MTATINHVPGMNYKKAGPVQLNWARFSERSMPQDHLEYVVVNPVTVPV